MSATLVLVLLLLTAPVAQNPPFDVIIESKVPSVEVKFQGRDPQTGNYMVLMHNTSSHLVMGLHIGEFSASEETNRGINGGILPSGLQSIAASEEELRAGFHLASALFDDGHFEGDPRIAVVMAGDLTGRYSQLLKLQGRVEPIIKGPGDDDSKIGVIKKEIAALSEKPVDVDIERLKNAFPSLPPCDSLCTRAMRASIQVTDRVFLYTLEKFESNPDRKSAVDSTLALWWVHTQLRFNTGWNNLEKR